MSSIRLHETKGVNPKLCFCPRCANDNGEIALPGADDRVWECTSCNVRHYGRKLSGGCPECHFSLTLSHRLGEHEKVPGSLCDDCKQREDDCNAEVRAGGVFWRCTSCGSEGAIKADSQLATLVREHFNAPPPAPVGCEFSDADCPVCGPNPVVS